MFKRGTTGVGKSARPGRAYRAAYVYHDIPERETPGSVFSFRVAVRNTGWSAWKRVPSDGQPARLAVYLDDRLLAALDLHKDRVAPASTALFACKLGAPREKGEHRLHLDLFIHSRFFFSERGVPSLNVPLIVGETIQMQTGSRWARFLYMKFPMLRLRFCWQVISRTFGIIQRTGWRPPWLLRRWKIVNKKLAVLEKINECVQVTTLPHELIIDVTTKCNLSCLRCFRRYLPIDLNRERDMPDEILGTIVKDLFPVARVVNLSLIGEPLLIPRLDRLLDKLRRYGVRLSLTTNGTQLGHNDLIQRLAPVLENLELSIDTPRADLFKTLRPGTSFEQVMNSARQVGQVRRDRAGSFKFGLSMTLFRENVDDLPAMVELAEEVGADYLRAAFGVVFARVDENHSVLNLDERYNRIRREASRVAEERGVGLVTPPDILEVGSCDTRVTCPFLYDVVHIDYRGYVAPCLHRDYPAPQAYVPADFRNIWNNPALQNLRAHFRTPDAHPSCRRCYVLFQRNSKEELKKTYQLF